MNVPYLSYEEIGRRADEFWKKYHPSGEIPVPIEEIVELQLGLDIITVPNMYVSYRINGYLGADRAAIYVDEFQYKMLHEKYRYTLAHEVGHFVLHEQVYSELTFTSLPGYWEYMNTADPAFFARCEAQGDRFAEQLLVPEETLIWETEQVVARNIDSLRVISASGDTILPYITKEIARPFHVAPKVIECRFAHSKGRIDFEEIMRKGGA